MKRYSGIISLVGLLAIVSGCSVGMALSGTEAPNLGAFGVGSPRAQVELHMGRPVSSVTLADDQRTDVYAYEVGNAPSAGRAVAHGVMDVLTLGIWEVVGTPIEAYQGERKSLHVTYGADDRVVSLSAGN
jgi:hypothetical protein